MKIRIKFAKYGTMKFIGHLDMMRFFQKAIRRADIDIKYTEGFSPHQVMSFAAPLGVGIESAGEYLDIEVNSLTSTAQIKDALNNVMVDGLRILSVKALPDTVKNAMASVAAAEYHVHAAGHMRAICKNVSENDSANAPSLFFAEGGKIEAIRWKLADFYAQEQIPVTKQTKKSTLELDLKPAIYELTLKEVVSPFYLGTNAYPVIAMLVNASSSGNIKPTMVLEALCAYCGIAYVPQAYQITRMETYTEISSFIPLEAVGSDYPGEYQHE